MARRTGLAAEVLGEHAVAAVGRVGDRQARAHDHRLEQPCERRVLVAHVLGDLRAGPALLHVGRDELADPRFDAVLGIAGLEAVDDVRQAQHPARAQHAGDPPQRDRLPEVRQVMQGEAAVDDVGRLARVLVGQEAGVDGLDVAGGGAAGELLAQAGQHDRRHIDRDHPLTDLRGGHRELAGAGPEVDDRRSGSQAARRLEQGDLAGGPGIHLGVVAARMLLVEVLAAGECGLVQPPAVGITRHLCGRVIAGCGVSVAIGPAQPLSRRFLDEEPVDAGLCRKRVALRHKVIGWPEVPRRRVICGCGRPLV